MATHSNFLKVLAAATLALTACTGSSDAIVADQRPIVTDTVEVALDASTTAAPASTTTTTTTTAAPAAPEGTTPVAVPAVLTPSEVEGSWDDGRTELRVLTSVGDPLNVRTGPGVGYEVVDELDHETNGITAVSGFSIDVGDIWVYVERDGEALGWVSDRYLFGNGATSTCVAGDDFPTFEGAVVAASDDVDLDGEEDEIFVLAQSNNSGLPGQDYDVWLLVSFANGGTATGQWTGYFEPHPVMGVQVFDLTTLGGAHDFNEIIFQVSSGASHGQHGVMTLIDCELVPTTLDGDPFAFSHGASAGHSSVGGCAYGPHGEIEFVMTNTNFNSFEWSSKTLQLSGSTWTELASDSGTGTDPSELPYGPNFTDCV